MFSTLITHETDIPRLIQEGDIVVTYESFTSLRAVTVDSKKNITNSFGTFEMSVSSFFPCIILHHPQTRNYAYFYLLPMHKYALILTPTPTNDSNPSPTCMNTHRIGLAYHTAPKSKPREAKTTTKKKKKNLQDGCTSSLQLQRYGPMSSAIVPKSSILPTLP